MRHDGPPATAGAATTDRVVSIDELERHRRALTGYCYRMLGGGAEAEDAAQEAIVRAWRAAGGFDGRSSVRSWLYRIATNVCIDMHRSPQRRARPVDLGPARPPEASSLADVLPEHAWITPIADERVLPDSSDPAEVAAARDSIRLAFVSALQHLPARQRAVLILADVLRWPAAEVAELLETSTASVNSALQRARATMAAAPPAEADTVLDDAQRALLDRYVAAFEAYDVARLATMLHADVIQTMPPYAMWLRGVDDIAAWYVGPGIGCAGSRLLSGRANGCPAFAQYRVDPDGGHTPWALQVLELRGDRIAAIHAFLGTRDVTRFGFPAHLPPD
ncbi:MAG TPA: sigma-70 family RNA polymerase sigma factor [Acidimicrobiales bacterium]|nr:sigma-70 family RNA polymerase sigma factor [Acidimicrobiales bacterium]